MHETEKWLVYEQEDFDKDIYILVEKLKPLVEKPSKEKFTATTRGSQMPLPTSFQLDGIFTPFVGGVVGAAYLHYRLKIPFLAAPTGRSLVFDDIADTGEQLVHYAKKGNLIVVLFWNPAKCLIKPHIHLHEKGEKWVHFMWEAPEDGDDRI